jgi:metal-sulfur cluster biosynthetic enzyme
MIKAIHIHGSLVSVGVSLTTAGCPLKHKITTQKKGVVPTRIPTK